MVGENAAAAGGGGMMKWLLLFSGIALVSITAYGVYGPEADTSPKILDVCVTHSDSINHYHPWLFININGNAVNIPTDVGVTQESM